tara:strand:- start:3071 stop:3295 length:225 start_codon:yes stop_codon:yes gene_type:complete
MTIRKTDIRNNIKLVAESLIEQNICSAEQLPFSLNAPGESKEFHNMVEYIEEQLQDYLLELATTAVDQSIKHTV